MSKLTVFLIFLALTCWTRPKLVDTWRGLGTESVQSEVLYLPQRAAVEFVSFGYTNALADVLWFNTINYFGKHYRSDQSYQWLSEMCSLVIALDPAAKHVYEFCSAMVSWEVKDHKAGLEILNQAVAQHPNDWRFRYFRGFHRMFFEQDSAGAHQDFAAASQLPGAHPIVARLAAKEAASLNQPEAAVEFLEDLIRKTRDPNERQAYAKRLQEIWYEIGFKWNQESIQAYRERFGKLPKSLNAMLADKERVLRIRGSLNQIYYLVILDPQVKIELPDLATFLAAGAVRVVLEDPYGEKFTIDGTSGQVKSASNRKRLTQYGQSPIWREEVGNSIKEAK